MAYIEAIQSAQYSRPYHREALPWSEIQARYRTAHMFLNPRGKSVLDFGGGDGAFATELANRGAKVSLFDIDENASRFATVDPRILILDGLYQLKNQFDIIIALEVLEHIPDDTTVVKNLSSMLKTGGQLLISVPSVNVPISKKHYGHYSLDTSGRKIKPMLKEAGLTLDSKYFGRYPFVDFNKIPGVGFRPKRLLSQLFDFALTMGLNNGIMFGGSERVYEKESTHVFVSAVKYAKIV